MHIIAVQIAMKSHLTKRQGRLPVKIAMKSHLTKQQGCLPVKIAMKSHLTKRQRRLPVKIAMKSHLTKQQPAGSPFQRNIHPIQIKRALSRLFLSIICINL